MLELRGLELSVRFCLSCGATIQRDKGSGAAGYALTPDGRTICYPCADAMQRGELVTAIRFFGYLDGRAIQTWTGGHLMTVTERWSHKRPRSWLSSEVVYVRAVDVHGNRWHGSGPGDGMYVRLRRSK
jgi:hypothetical protein